MCEVVTLNIRYQKDKMREINTENVWGLTRNRQDLWHPMATEEENRNCENDTSLFNSFDVITIARTFILI